MVTCYSIRAGQKQIHNDSVVMVTSTDLTLDKFTAIVHDISNGSILKTGQAQIFLRTLYHSLGCIYMNYRRARSCSRSRCATGISKEVKHAQEFLQEGSKVKASVFFKGRSIIYADQGEKLLLRFAVELEEFGRAEQMPKLEGKRMIMMIAPLKKK